MHLYCPNYRKIMKLHLLSDVHCDLIQLTSRLNEFRSLKIFFLLSSVTLDVVGGYH